MAGNSTKALTYVNLFTEGLHELYTKKHKNNQRGGEIDMYVRSEDLAT